MRNFPYYITIDGETSGACNGTYGNAFTRSNGLCVIGWGNSNGASCARGESNPQLPEMDLLVGFNIKFDLHWARRAGIHLPERAALWDCQLAEFIICRQKNPMPSLEETVEKYGIGEKYVDIETEYWDKGIDTPDIPFDIVATRVKTDVVITSRLFEHQWDYLRDKPKLKKLIWLACQDIQVLEEMEWNGLAYDLEKSKQEGDRLTEQAEEIKKRLTTIVGFDGINWGSPKQLSAVLYGGKIPFTAFEKYVYTYKSGKRKGQTVLKERKNVVDVEFPRMVEPLKGSELKEDGLFSTDDGTLKKLRPRTEQGKEIVKYISTLRELLKRVGTYYYGLPKLYKEMGWQNGILHGNLNTCVAVTGRLSSSQPNQQNMDRNIRECIVTRFQ